MGHNLSYSTMRLHIKMSLSKSTSTTEDITDCKRVAREKKESVPLEEGNIMGRLTRTYTRNGWHFVEDILTAPSLPWSHTKTLFVRLWGCGYNTTLHRSCTFGFSRVCCWRHVSSIPHLHRQGSVHRPTSERFVVWQMEHEFSSRSLPREQIREKLNGQYFLQGHALCVVMKQTKSVGITLTKHATWKSRIKRSSTTLRLRTLQTDARSAKNRMYKTFVRQVLVRVCCV